MFPAGSGRAGGARASALAPGAVACHGHRRRTRRVRRALSPPAASARRGRPRGGRTGTTAPRWAVRRPPGRARRPVGPDRRRDEARRHAGHRPRRGGQRAHRGGHRRGVPAPRRGLGGARDHPPRRLALDLDRRPHRRDLELHRRAPLLVHLARVDARRLPGAGDGRGAPDRIALRGRPRRGRDPERRADPRPRTHRLERPRQPTRADPPDHRDGATGAARGPAQPARDGIGGARPLPRGRWGRRGLDQPVPEGVGHRRRRPPRHRSRRRVPHARRHAAPAVARRHRVRRPLGAGGRRPRRGLPPGARGDARPGRAHRPRRRGRRHDGGPPPTWGDGPPCVGDR